MYVLPPAGVSLVEAGHKKKSKPCTHRRTLLGFSLPTARCRGTMEHYATMEDGRRVERYVCMSDHNHTEAVYGRQDEA